MRSIVYSSESIENLKKIYDHVEKNFSAKKAQETIGVIFEKISNLKQHPFAGKTSLISELVRELLVEGNTVYYQVTVETIDIVYLKPRGTELLDYPPK